LHFYFQVEIKNLQSLCKRKGAGDKEIQNCAANGGGKCNHSNHTHKHSCTNCG